MQEITIYRAIDGTEYTNKEDARKRDVLCISVDAAMLSLGKVPQEVKDGKGWLQHDLETVNKAKDRILELCREQGYDKEYPAFKKQGRKCHPFSIIGRVLDDFGGPLRTAWYRFMCIDEQGREHQQPYFAYTNGPDPRHFCIESRERKKRKPRKQNQVEEYWSERSREIG